MAFKNLSYFKISFKVKEKTDCVLWYAEEKIPTKVQWKFHEKYGRNSYLPNNKTNLRWV